MMADLPPAIGRYRPMALLGAGAMGSVYKAHDPLIDRMVAIKVVRAEALDPATKTAFLQRFRVEVQAAARCAHPAIVGVYDYVEDAGGPSIVMELVEGDSLQRVLQDAAARAALPAVPVVLQVLEGIGYAHGQGVIHRDIKPANIIVSGCGQAKIADFGIARLNEAALTHSGAMIGTPQYMAPEQVTDDAVDRRADLFAVGAVLYEILAGRPPFAGRTLADTVLRLSGPQEADMAPVEPAYAAVLQRALAKDRARRFQTADEFALALQRAADACAPTVVAAGRSASRRVWDPELLQRVERQFAVHAGPMARRTVARAAQDAASVDELYAMLARSLPSAADRGAFLRAMGGARVEPTLGAARRPAAAVAGSGGTLAAATVIPGAVVASAQTALAFFVGPIARVLVRDAAMQAVSSRDFVDRLCAHVANADEAAQLRRRLQAVC